MAPYIRSSHRIFSAVLAVELEGAMLLTSREYPVSPIFHVRRVSHGRSLRLAAIALTAVVVMSCESGSGIGPVKETPIIANLTGNKTAVEVSLGTSTTVAYTIQRGGGYSGPVTFTIEGVPAGVIASFTPASLDKSSISTVLTIGALPAATAVSKILTVKVTGDGVDPKTLPLTLTVIVPSLTVSAGAGPFSTVLETPLVVPITITRVGVLTDVVTLSIPNLPAGFSASFSATQLAPEVSTATLTLTPVIGATIGLSNVTVHATSIDATTDLAIPVTIVDFPTPTFRVLAASSIVSLGAAGAGPLATRNDTMSPGLTSEGTNVRVSTGIQIARSFSFLSANTGGGVFKSC